MSTASAENAATDALPCPINLERESPSEFLGRLRYPIRIDLTSKEEFTTRRAYRWLEGYWRERGDLPPSPISAGHILIQRDHAIRPRLESSPVGDFAKAHLSSLQHDGIAWVLWRHFRWQPIPGEAEIRGHPLWPLAVFFHFQDRGFEARIGCWDWRDLMTLFGFLEVPEEELLRPGWHVEFESQKKKEETQQEPRE